MSKERSVSTETISNKMNDCVQVNLRITTNSNQGGRKYMEDAYAIALQRLNPSDKESPISLAYFGIFDGHGGKEAAEFARQNLCQHILEQDEFWSTNNSDENANDQMILSAIRKGFLACHNEMWNHVAKWAKTSSGLPSTSGCTASVVFIRGNKLYIGHVGDSAIVLGEGETLCKSWKVHRLTRDHKPEDPLELKRIRESGGNVLCKAGVHRVVWNRQKTNSSHQYRHRHQHSIATTTTASGTTIEYEQIPFLAVSRALGDLWSLNSQTNLYSVSPEPELTVIEIDPNKHRCLILASDGLWNMITPEMAVEVVRNCDVKTEEMILKAEDDDHRPFRNPSHELVHKALNSWRERMLRSDNITCITVMLDPPGPPFSDCIVKKKKQRLTYSTSSSTASVCSDDTVELDHLLSMSTTGTTATATATTTTLQKPKPVLQRKEHILTPISNGPTPVRTPKRPASDETPSLLVDTPRRKLIKTNQQKENGRTSSSTNVNSSESETISSASSSYLLLPVSSTNQDEDDLLSTERLPISSESNGDLTRESVRNNREQHLEENSMDVDQLSQDSCDEKFDRCSRSIFLLNNNSSHREEEEQILPRRRTRSASTITTTMINQDFSRRRKSCSHTDFINDTKPDAARRANNSDKCSTEKKSPNKCSVINVVIPTSPQSLTSRVKQVLLRPNHSSCRLINSVVSSSPPQESFVSKSNL